MRREDLALGRRCRSSVGQRRHAAEAHRDAVELQQRARRSLGVAASVVPDDLRGLGLAGPRPASAPSVPSLRCPRPAPPAAAGTASRPCGRTIIMITSAAPKTRTRYSANPRNRSGSHATRNAPEDDAGDVARPRRGPPRRGSVADRMNGKSVGRDEPSGRRVDHAGRAADRRTDREGPELEREASARPSARRRPRPPGSPPRTARPGWLSSRLQHDDDQDDERDGQVVVGLRRRDAEGRARRRRRRSAGAGCR